MKANEVTKCGFYWYWNGKSWVVVQVARVFGECLGCIGPCSKELAVFMAGDEQWNMLSYWGDDLFGPLPLPEISTESKA